MFYFLGVILDLDKYIFPWQTYFFGGSSDITVVLHLDKYGNEMVGGTMYSSNMTSASFITK